jgi:hypothetical protein
VNHGMPAEPLDSGKYTRRPPPEHLTLGALRAATQDLPDETVVTVSIPLAGGNGQQLSTASAVIVRRFVAIADHPLPPGRELVDVQVVGW